MRPWLLLIALPCLSGCLQSTALSRGYDRSRIHNLSVWRFESSFPGTTGVEDIFAKHLMSHDFKVIERTQLESILQEQRLSLSGALSPETLKTIGKIAGVDGIILGTITTYVPERREVTRLPVDDTFEEPIFEKRKEKQPNGSLADIQLQIGTKVRKEHREVPHVYTVDAQVGLVVKLVDVETGEIAWVGSYVNQGANAPLAMESTIAYLVGRLRKEWKPLR